MTRASWSSACIFLAVIAASPLPAHAQINAEALCDAAARGTPDEIASLIKAGNNPDGSCYADSIGDGIPLAMAAMSMQQDNVVALLDAGATVDAVHDDGTENNETALFTPGNAAIAKLLISRGATVDFRNFYDQTPLGQVVDDASRQEAIMTNSIAIAKVLLDHGANVNNVAVGGQTVLMEIGRYDSRVDTSAMLEFLIAHGADVNRKDEDGNTALERLTKTEHDPTFADDTAYLHLLRKYETILKAHGAQ